MTKKKTANKRSRVKVGKLQGPAKKLSAKEQKKVRGGSPRAPRAVASGQSNLPDPGI